MKRSLIRNSFLTAALVGGIAVSASGQGVLAFENFEAGNMDNWTGWTASNVEFRAGSGPSGAGDTHLFYDPGLTAFAAGTNALWGTPFSVTPTAAQPLVLTGDIWYNGNINQRNTIGLRTGADPLFEVGMFNSGNNGLGARILAFAGNENWVEVVSYGDLGTGAENARWISTVTTFTDTTVSITFTDSKPVVDGGFGTLALNSAGVNPTGAFSDLRIGGPSGVSSAGGGMGYDNIRLEVIPEPSTYAAIFGGLALLGAFVYRRRLSAKK